MRARLGISAGAPAPNGVDAPPLQAASDGTTNATHVRLASAMPIERMCVMRYLRKDGCDAQGRRPYGARPTLGVALR